MGAKMAGTCGCDKTRSCQCCDQPGNRAAQSEVDDLRAQLTRLEGELAAVKMPPD
jgi:hypothetical protein